MNSLFLPLYKACDVGLFDSIINCLLFKKYCVKLSKLFLTRCDNGSRPAWKVGAHVRGLWVQVPSSSLKALGSYVFKDLELFLCNFFDSIRYFFSIYRNTI